MENEQNDQPEIPQVHADQQQIANNPAVNPPANPPNQVVQQHANNPIVDPLNNANAPHIENPVAAAQPALQAAGPAANAIVPQGVIENARIVKVQRDSVFERLRNWVAFVHREAFMELDPPAIQIRLERGIKLMQQAEEVQLELIGATSAARQGIAELGEQFMLLEEHYNTAAAAAVRRAAELRPADRPPPAANAAQQQVLRLQMQEQNIQNTWGHFDGQLLKWKEFKQHFSAMIHSNNDVSNLYKFSHLKKSLHGKALELLNGLDVNADNYPAAWQALTQEYDRRYPLAREYLKQFFMLKGISTPATAEELRKVSKVTKETISNLTGLGYQVQAWNVLMVHVIHGLLNEALAYEWNLTLTRANNDDPSVDDITAFLDQHSRAATSGRVPQPHPSIIVQLETSNRGRNESPANRNNPGASGTAQSNHSARGSAANMEKWTYPCGACEGNHKVFFCPEFVPLDYEARWQVVKKKRMCPLCLKRGHQLAECRDRHRCDEQQCRHDPRHNSMLCPVKVAAKPSRHQHLARPAHEPYYDQHRDQHFEQPSGSRSGRESPSKRRRRGDSL